MGVKLSYFVLPSVLLINLLSFGQDVVLPKSALDNIKQQKRLLRNEAYKKEEALKSDKKEWKSALDSENQEEFIKVEKKLEALEIKFEVNRLKKERDFLKKYEKVGIRKTRLTRLENMEKELEEEKISKKRSRDLSKINKDVNKIIKERNNLEKIVSDDYVQSRLIEIDKKIEDLNSRSKKLRENSAVPKKYKKEEIRDNLKKIDQELRLLRANYHEAIANLEQEALRLKALHKEAVAKANLEKQEAIKLENLHKEPVAKVNLEKQELEPVKK